MRDDGIVVIAIVSFLSGCALTSMLTAWYADEWAEMEAVKHHAAQWVTGANGDAQFKWNDEILKEK